MLKKNCTRALLLGVAPFLIACGEQASTPQHVAADIVLENGYIYTVDADRSVAQSIAIKGNKIVAVGATAVVAAHIGPNTEVRDLGGKMVMPGLHDMHIHALGSVKPDMCDLGGEGIPLDTLVATVKECVTHYKVAEGDWMPVLQWNPFEGNQPSNAYPTIRAALDAAAPNNPIIMWGNDGHHGAVNTLALNSPTVPINAESLKTTYAEFAGLIAVDTNGEPTGGMTEGARNIVRADMDNDMLGVSASAEALMPRVAAKMAQTGITSLQDAAVTKSVLAHYKWLDDNDGMTFRVRTALLARADGGKSPATADAISHMINSVNEMRASVDGAKYIRANAVKLFADGVLEGNPYGNPPTMPNAAMIDGFHQPLFTINNETGNADVTGYVDLESALCKTVQQSPTIYASKDAITAFLSENGFVPKQCLKQYGVLDTTEDIIKSYVKAATENDYHVHIHALGDKAVRVSADAFEQTKELADKKGLTQSIAHLQIGKTEDIKRLGALGAYVAFTYIWATPEPEYEMTVIPFMDKVKGINDLYNPDHYYMKNGYPFKSILDNGGVPVFGSDTPVGNRNPRPFGSMEIALTREFGGRVLNASERLNIHEAIASFTINSAGMMARRDELGSLEVGKLADLIVLDQNVVELAENGDVSKISDTKVLTTVFDGRIVHDTP